jgi:serine/threonine protein kinase
MCFIYNRIQGGELFERVIDDDFILTERACAVFMRQICEGIEFIHSRNIIHLDMKVNAKVFLRKIIVFNYFFFFISEIKARKYFMLNKSGKSYQNY